MKVFNNSKISKAYKRSIIAIGNFDGAHIGHQKVFNEAKKFAKRNKIKFGILSFTPLPIMFFNKKIKNYRLSSENQKIKLLEKYKSNFMIKLKFNKSLSNMSAENFLRNIIFKRINPKYIFVSNNFKFGKNRIGNIGMLKRLSKKYDYNLVNTNPVKYDKKIVSSTRIRKCLETGNLFLANKLLTRTWVIEERVRKGKRIGKKLGYPTCNIDIGSYATPKIGVYAVKIIIENNKKVLKGIANFGNQPTFGGTKLLLEVNLFKFKKNLYNKKLKIYFIKYIRNEKKFRNSRELIQQIKKDVILAKKHLKTKIVL
tara:strand:+ start:65 stop:1003 length:939 start_codon:yes stop_codon:yes gene_type:complete